MSKKHPYLGHTEEEITKIESNYFCLVLGGDFVSEDGYYLFTKSEVYRLHNRTLKRLIKIVENGDEKDKRYALDLIGRMIIKPMRFH